MKSIPVAELVFDATLYPRASIDRQHVSDLAEAISAGAKLPPIIIDGKSKRIIDGVHRSKAYARLYGEQYEVEVVEKKFISEGEMLAEAVKLNAGHGRTLSRFDRVHCLLMADKVGLTIEAIAGAMSMTLESAVELTRDRVGTLTTSHSATQIPLKRTVRHMAGGKITSGQAEANRKLGGMSQTFYVNQVLLLLRNDMVDWSDETMINRLVELRDMLVASTKLAAERKTKSGAAA